MTQETTQSNLRFAAEELLKLLDNTLAPLLPPEIVSRVRDGLQEGLMLADDIDLLKELKIQAGDGKFIPLIPDGLNRTNDYTTLVGRIGDGTLRKFFDVTKFKVNANHVRTLIDTPEQGGPNNKATFLLIYPGQRLGGIYTMVLAAGDKNGKTLKNGSNPQVLDEIDPCKPCSRIEQ